MSGSPVMIAPKKDLPLLGERPRFKNPGWVRLCGRIAAPIVRMWRRRARARAERDLGRLVEFAATCQSRVELERSLGAPQYALVGRAFGSKSSDGEVFVPDRVETYAKGDCVVELWFRGERVASITGFVQWSAWDLAAGLAA